jgi:hypothetical protein
MSDLHKQHLLKPSLHSLFNSRKEQKTQEVFFDTKTTCILLIWNKNQKAHNKKTNQIETKNQQG